MDIGDHNNDGDDDSAHRSSDGDDDSASHSSDRDDDDNPGLQQNLRAIG